MLCIHFKSKEEAVVWFSGCCETDVLHKAKLVTLYVWFFANHSNLAVKNEFSLWLTYTDKCKKRWATSWLTSAMRKEFR